MTPVINFNLVTMLPFIREAFDAGQLQGQNPANIGGSCDYAGPCAIGVCIAKEDRAKFDSQGDGGDTSAESWIDRGKFVVPKDQQDDFLELQSKHDRCLMGIHYHKQCVAELGEFITELEQKYGTG